MPNSTGRTAPAAPLAFPETPAVDTGLAAWLKQLVSPGTLLTICTIVISAAVSHGAYATREDALDARLKIVESKYVPREEHASKDELVRDQLKDIQAQLHRIETVLMERGK